MMQRVSGKPWIIVLVASLLIFMLSGRAAAEKPKSSSSARPRPSQSQPRPSQSQPSPSQSQPSQDMSFDLFGNEQKKSPLDEARDKERLAKLERSAQLRRKLLLSHQAIGFATLGVLAATMVLGTLEYVDKYGGGDDSGIYYNAHLGLAVTSGGLFAATGILALAAPNPYPKPIKFDPALVHKIAMAVATAGMVTQFVLGPVIAAREGQLDQRNLALAHLITGWGTFGFMGAGVLAYVF
jgi:hypothetical protein